MLATSGLMASGTNHGRTRADERCIRCAKASAVHLDRQPDQPISGTGRTCFPLRMPWGTSLLKEGYVVTYYDEKAWISCMNICLPGWSWVPPMNPRPMSGISPMLIKCVVAATEVRCWVLVLGPTARLIQGVPGFLLELGDWLKLNGDAIYNTRGGPYLPGIWGGATCKGNKVFLFVKEWNDGCDQSARPAGRGGIYSG